jgi:hypothetical protein
MISLGGWKLRVARPEAFITYNCFTKLVASINHNIKSGMHENSSAVVPDNKLVS